MQKQYKTPLELFCDEMICKICNEDANRKIATFVGCNRSSFGCLLPPTGRLSGRLGRLPCAVLESVDFERKQMGMKPIYDRYYIYPSTPKDNQDYLTTKDIEHKDNHPHLKKTKDGIIVDGEAGYQELMNRI